jgi:aryl-alcohol dehydrogenase-like predicted oxidoreductase
MQIKPLKGCAMKFRRLGKSNLRVSELCLGTMMFGDQTDAAESASIVDYAFDQGMNFIDTADVYSKGLSEKITGDCIRAKRDHWVLATKLGNFMSKSPNEGGYSRQWILREAEASLQRLGTDYIDILYMHRDWELDQLEEPLRAMADLIRAGKIRSFALSNFRGWRIAEVVRLCDAMHMPRPVCCQPYYNLLNRMPEVEILPACGHYGLGVVPYSPIARGILTGKYQPGVAPAADTRAGRNDARMMQSEWRPESLEIAQKIKAHAERDGTTLLAFAVAWVLANKHISSVIVGPKSLAQFKPYFAALEVAWHAEHDQLVDALVAPGHPSTPGYTDPAYPFYGR